MSSNYAIGEPHIIASLPRPFNSENGKLRASPVYSLEGSRKRKRNEIVAGIDGEAVNVYHVRLRNVQLA